MNSLKSIMRMIATEAMESHAAAERERRQAGALVDHVRNCELPIEECGVCEYHRDPYLRRNAPPPGAGERR